MNGDLWYPSSYLVFRNEVRCHNQAVRSDNACSVGRKVNTTFEMLLSSSMHFIGQ